MPLAPGWDLLVNGDKLPAEYRDLITSITVDATVDGADELVIRALAWNPGPTGTRYRFVGDNAIGLGNEVVALAGWEDGEIAALQRFRIMRLEPNFPSQGVPTVAIRGYSAEHRLVEFTAARQFERGIPDSEIVREIAEEHGLTVTADSLADTTGPDKPRARVKAAGTTDWKFVQQLATANDFGPPFVRYDEGLDADVLYFRPTSLEDQDEIATFVYDPMEAGSEEPSGTLWSFAPSLSLAGMPTRLEVIGRDPVAQTPIVLTLEITDGGLAPITIRQGEPAEIDEYVRSGAQLQVTILDNAPNAEPEKREVIVSELDMTTTDDARAFAERWYRTRLQAFAVARATTVGFERLWIAQVHRFEGLPALFAGLWETLGVRHTVDGQGYRCSLDLARVVEEDAEQPQEV